MRDSKLDIILQVSHSNLASVGKTGNVIDVTDFQHLTIELGTDSTASLQFSVIGSVSEDAPDFSSAQSKTNLWGYIPFIDLQTKTEVTTLALTASAFRLLKVNTTGLKWLSVRLMDYTSGTPFFKVLKVTNN